MYTINTDIHAYRYPNGVVFIFHRPLSTKMFVFTLTTSDVTKRK